MAVININNVDHVESRMPLEPLMNKETKKLLFDGIPFVKLVRVNVVFTKHEKGEYKDLEVPELQIEFINHKVLPDDPDRFALLREKCIHTCSTIEGSEDVKPMDKKLVNDLTIAMWQRIKHIHDAFSFSPSWVDFATMTKEEVATYLNLTDEGTPEERVEMFTKFFTYVSDKFNGVREGGNVDPIFKAGNAYHIMRLKVVAEYKKGTYYSIPTYVKQGFIEKARMVDNKWKSPITVYKLPTDNFTLTEGKPKSSILGSLTTTTDASTESLLQDMGI